LEEGGGKCLCVKILIGMYRSLQISAPVCADRNVSILDPCATIVVSLPRRIPFSRACIRMCVQTSVGGFAHLLLPVHCLPRYVSSFPARNSDQFHKELDGQRFHPRHVRPFLLHSLPFPCLLFTVPPRRAQGARQPRLPPQARPCPLRPCPPRLLSRSHPLLPVTRKARPSERRRETLRDRAAGNQPSSNQSPRPGICPPRSGIGSLRVVPCRCDTSCPVSLATLLPTVLGPVRSPPAPISPALRVPYRLLPTPTP
jgi:hypothetical protein